MLPVTLLLVAAPRFQLRRADGANGLAAEASRAVNSHIDAVQCFQSPLPLRGLEKTASTGTRGNHLLLFFALLCFDTRSVMDWILSAP